MVDPDGGSAPAAGENVPPTGPGAPAAGVDGRTARRDRNQQAVLDAVLTLFREDNLQPKPEEVAARSGVSLRSVYRYYSEPRTLLTAAMARQLELVAPFWELPRIGEGGLDERVERILTQRSDLYDRVAPTARAARLAAVDNELIRVQFERSRERLSSQVETHFARELGRMSDERRAAAYAAVDSLLQLDGFEYFRVYRAFSAAETNQLLKIAMLQLLAAT